MMKIGSKRIVLQAAVLLLAAAALCGCGGDGKVVADQDTGAGGQQKSQAMGRYVESEIVLPEGITYEAVISFQSSPDGKPVLFTKNEVNGTAEFTGYLLTDSLTWEEKACKWLNQLELADTSNIGIFYGEDHKLYAVYSDGDDQERISRHHIVVTEDWENGREIQIPALLEKNELGYAYYPNSITALENGSLVFDSGSRLFLYEASGQQKIAEVPGGNGYTGVYKNQFYVIDGESRSLILYDGVKGMETKRYPLELSSFFEAEAVIDENGDISILSKDGIQILKNGADIWEQIVEGKRNTMGSPKYYPTGFAKGSQEDYFVYYESMDETSKLTRYTYQPDMPVEPETELTVFALYDNSTIRQAVSVFQIENPNVKVDFQPLTEQVGAAVPEDYIRTLNAELLSGGGPDVLILDGLSEIPYIEKGVLADITDQVETLVSSGDFLANIADSCRVDGRIYSVPVKIGLPLTFGRKAALNEADQLDTLAALVQSQEVGQVFGTLDREAFLSFYADAFLPEIVSEDGGIREQELKDFLLCTKQILDGSRCADGTRENRPSSEWRLLEEGIYLHSDVIAGFFDSGSGTSVVEQAEGELEGDMIAVNRAYIPYGTMGINKAGEHKELAAAFLQTALSQEVQRSDFYDGFSVNQNVLEFLSGIERNSSDGYGGDIQGVDGRTYEMKSVWPSPNQRRQLVDFCKEAEYSAGRNQRVKQILLEYSTGYYDGTMSLEEAAGKLTSKITLYLQE